MPRHPRPHWDRRENSYRTDARGRIKYFRGIARDDHVGIAQAFSEYLSGIDAEARPVEITADDLCVRFLDAARGVKPRTVQSHQERLLVWSEWGRPPIGKRPAASLTARDLKVALRQWESGGLSAHYRAGICRSVKAAWRWAASEEGGRLIPSNPFAEVRPPTVGRAPERYAERREVAAFLRFAWRRAEKAPGIYRRFGRNLVLLMRVAAHTGARPGELCAAWWEDFDPGRGTIVLPPERHKTGGKTGQPRVIFLTPALVRALVRERKRPDRHPTSIFVHKRGKGGVGRGATREQGEPWGRFVELPDGKAGFDADSSALSKAVRKLRSEAIAAGIGIKAEGNNRFVLYRLRHTYISDGLMTGAHGASVAEVTGTSERMIQQVYGHLLEGHLQETAETIARGRKRPGKPGR